jgi:hypothetical protein
LTSPSWGKEWVTVSVRKAIGTTFGTTASAISHLRWWLDWHARSNPTDGCRGIER